MDAGTIADALIVGRDLPAAKLQRLVMIGDDGDRPYVWLFQIIRGLKAVESFDVAMAEVCPHEPTVAAWSHISRYAHAPNQINYSKIVTAARAWDDTSWTLLRLAPLALVGRHRRNIIGVVKQAVRVLPELRTDMQGVMEELRMRGPVRLYAKRTGMVRSRGANVR
jgi:hypothetical protein